MFIFLFNSTFDSLIKLKLKVAFSMSVKHSLCFVIKVTFIL